MESLTTRLMESELEAEGMGSNSNIDDDGYANEDKDYVRVALIDDGLNPEYEGLGQYLSGSGAAPSKNSGDRLVPGGWWTPGRNQHGNRMAKLITSVCPFVRLYVAKIDSGPCEGKQSHPTFNINHAIDVSY